MWSIILVLLIGMAIGIKMPSTDKVKKNISKFQFLGVMILLFAMGAGLGLNKDLLSNLKSMGIEATVFAVLTTFLSIAFVFISSRFLLKEKK